jgi:uncharacterized membrane protein
MKKISLTTFILSTLFIWSCTKDSTSNCGSTTFKYSTDISPIITAKCNTSGCHNSSAAGGLNFTTYASVKQNSSRIRNAVNNGSMPKAGSPAITADEKTKLFSWIDACSPDN